jgi:hypothetical protein
VPGRHVGPVELRFTAARFVFGDLTRKGDLTQAHGGSGPRARDVRCGFDGL